MEPIEFTSRLRTFYGILRPENAPIQLDRLVVWDQACGGFGIKNGNSVDEGERRYLSVLMEGFQNPRANTTNPSAYLMEDLEEGHPEFLGDRLDGWRLESVPGPVKNGSRSHLVHQWYRFRATSQSGFLDQNYEVWVNNPLVALGCLRMRVGAFPWTKSSELVGHLVKMGASFRTVKIVPPPYFLGAVEGRSVGLGLRRSDFRPSIHDFATYLDLLSQFARQPRAHAALLYGGIVWRLVQGLIPVEAAAGGPSFSESGGSLDWDSMCGSSVLLSVVLAME